jgi:hypothetical protein
MPHAYPRAAFQALVADNNLPPLARLYAALVTLELALKDDHQMSSGNWTAGHDVPTMMGNFDASLATTLGNALGSLRCTDKHGNDSPIASALYPHMRYLRHESDFPPPPIASSETDIAATLAVAMDCINVLRNANLLS